MKASKEYMKKNNISAYISFKDGQAHTFKLIDDKEDSIKDTRSGVDVVGVRYLVEENGEKKSFFTSSSALISKLAEFEPGTIVTARLTSTNAGGQYKSVYEVVEGEVNLAQSKITDEPTIQADDPETQSLEDIANEQASW